MSEQQTPEQIAARIGASHGRNAASWYFDGNTSRETYERVLAGIDDGDPEIMDALPSSPLSGEWADSYSQFDLADDAGLVCDERGLYDDFDLTAVCEAYTNAFEMAACAEIERAARYQLS
jgi:hypothetical protein